jgi:hypothetical protein
MKKYLFLSMFINVLCFGQKLDSRETILKLLEQQTNDWNNGNIDAFMQGYAKSDSLMFIGKNGITYSWEKTLINYKIRYPDRATMGILKFEVLKMDFLSKKSCWVLGKWHLNRPEKGDIGGYYTLIFKKIKGKWVIVSDHTS